MTETPRILVFDSGLGGLSVGRALRDVAKDAQIAYAADNAAFPYGNWAEKALVARMVKVMTGLIEESAPDVVVIACNTASTIGLETLRGEFSVPFVGTVPAIKPAANATKTGRISVLATPGTVKRDYTKALIDTYAYHCKVKLHGAKNLAQIAEAKMTGAAVDLNALEKEIAPAFVEDAKGRTDAVVLGCTHYPLLLEEIAEVAPWPVKLIDPSTAIARQAMARASDGLAAGQKGWGFANHAFLTATDATNAGMQMALIKFGFHNISCLDQMGVKYAPDLSDQTIFE